MIHVYVFENDRVDCPSRFLDEVVKVDGTSVAEVYGGSVPISWHPVWNHFPGSIEEPAIRTRKLICNDARFFEAMHACREARGMCLMFFDMNLGVVLTANHLTAPPRRGKHETEEVYAVRTAVFMAKVQLLLEAVTGETTTEKQAAYLNNKMLHGMVLLINALANPDIDADVFAATQKYPEREVEQLRKKHCRAKLIGSVSKVGHDNGETAAGRVRLAIEEFCSARTFKPEELFWPPHATEWFISTVDIERERLPIPHNFEKFDEWYPSTADKCGSQLGSYLRQIAINGYRRKKQPQGASVGKLYDKLPEEGRRSIDAAVSAILGSKWLYENCLKTFVGRGTLLSGNGGEKPNVACFLIPLLAATGPAKWVDSIHEMDTAAAIYKFANQDKDDYAEEDVRETREIIIKGYELFAILARDDKKETENQISVSFSRLANCSCLSVVVGFPAVTRYSEKQKDDLLSLTQFGTSLKHESGTTTNAYLAFQRACTPVAKKVCRSVYSWILPGAEVGTTEIRIAGVERG